MRRKGQFESKDSEALQTIFNVVIESAGKMIFLTSYRRLCLRSNNGAASRCHTVLAIDEGWPTPALSTPGAWQRDDQIILILAKRGFRAVV